MPNKKLELAGMRFGLLVAIRSSDKKNNGHIMWVCACDCGNEVTIRASSLKIGNSKSCGCVTRKKANERIAKDVREGYENSRVDGVFVPSIDRAKTNTNNKSGITGVCFDKSRQKWAVYIGIDKKKIFLGRFDNLNDAVRAREKAEQEYHQPLIDEYKKR